MQGLETKPLQSSDESVNPYNSSFDMLTADLKRLKKNGYRWFSYPDPDQSEAWRRFMEI